MTDPRQLSGAALAAALVDSRARTLAWTLDLSDAQWRPPLAAGINPLAWELTHLAWFAEFFVLRGPHTVGADGVLTASRPARYGAPDAIFDSARLPHAARWDVPLPSRDEVVARLAGQLDASLAVLAALPEDAGDDALYLHRLALFHEDMHGEAIAWLRSTLGYPAPGGIAAAIRQDGVGAAAPSDAMPGLVEQVPARVTSSARASSATLASEPRSGETAARTTPSTLRIDAAVARLGRPPGSRGFAFDNEQPGAEQPLAAYEVDAAPVTAGDYLRFVDSGGYDQADLWPGQAGAWRAASGRRQPLYWRRRRGDGGGWEARSFDCWLPLDKAQPMIHVNAWEAEAYCHWAGRRLPSAAEWEHAAQAEPARFAWGGSVWEWTADAFQPYPGFRAGLYADYSAPWFGSHRELRGGAFATPARLHAACFRNFFTPDRADIFAGFRTVSRARN